jgi:hypothetical protein
MWDSGACIKQFAGYATARSACNAFCFFVLGMSMTGVNSFSVGGGPHFAHRRQRTQTGLASTLTIDARPIRFYIFQRLLRKAAKHSYKYAVRRLRCARACTQLERKTVLPAARHCKCHPKSPDSAPTHIRPRCRN